MLPSFIRIQDIADILIMTVLLYQLYSWFRKTRAMQVLFGLGVITAIYFATRFLDLYMTSWILQELGTVLIILIIVVFQGEIRQALYRFSLLQKFFDPDEKVHHSHFQMISETVFRLAEKRVGALLVIKRDESLADLMMNGVKLDCEITPQILETIFATTTPLHDGAVLLRDGRIDQASCHLPLSNNPDVPQQFGTRHRAALGLSERTDAVVLVVSEERGEVTLVEGGEFRVMTDPLELSAALDSLVNPVRPASRPTVRQRLFSNLLPKTALFLVVTIFWALVTARQGQITTLSVPVRLQGVSENLIVVRSTPEEVDVQIKTFSSLAPAPAKLDIAANLDVSGLKEGQTSVRIKNTDFSLPSGMVVTSVNPPVVKVVTERKARKRVPVKAHINEQLPAGLMVSVSPALVELEGPAGQLARVDSVATEEIDARRLEKDHEYRKNLIQPGRNISILHDEPVVLKVTPRRKKR